MLKLNDLLILGDGVHGLEMVEIVERINGDRPTWNLVGFVSRDAGRKGEIRHGLPVLGGPELIAQYPKAYFISDNEWPHMEALPRERCATLIDPSAFVSRSATVGVGCVIYPHCYVGVNARIGDFVFALSGCTINHDDVVEDRVVLASKVTLAGNLHVEADCYLGQSCTIRQHLRIGRGSMIGMGAVVIRDVAPGSTIVGNPGRVLVKG